MDAPFLKVSKARLGRACSSLGYLWDTAGYLCPWQGLELGGLYQSLPSQTALCFYDPFPNDVPKTMGQTHLWKALLGGRQSSQALQGGQAAVLAELCCLSLPDMLLYRYVVSRLIWAYMLSIAMTYFITLCLFPGLESEIHNCTLGEWLPILIMAIFNLSDFVGKVGERPEPAQRESVLHWCSLPKQLGSTKGHLHPRGCNQCKAGTHQHGHSWSFHPLVSLLPQFGHHRALPTLLTLLQHNLCPLLQILAALPYDWRGTHLLVYSCLRVVFIPLFIMCVYPNGQPTFGHPAWPCIFSLLMGITNGYFGSVPMILAAGKVSPEQRELAGRTEPSRESHMGWSERPDTPCPLPQGTP